jgi:CubicO group peptidase (beta-lactamase class C family)
MHDAWVGQQMQVRDLLIHNSGLGLGAGDLMLWPEPNAFTRADIIAGLAHLKPVSSFRSHYAYDNLMYVVAGEVAAAAGGKPYDQLMREQVFEPLGMTRCQVGAWSVKRVGNVAQPHAWRGERNEVVNADAAISPDLPSMAAGGIRCSLRDMTRWMQVLLDPALVPDWLGSEQRRTLWTLHMPMPLGERQRRWDNAHFYGYGYGWRVSDMDGQWKVAHTGTLSGMYSSLALLPDRKVGVVMLINGEGEDARTALMQATLKRFTAPDDARPAMEYLAELKADQAAQAASGHQRPATAAAQPARGNDLPRWQGRYPIRGWARPRCARARTACVSAWTSRPGCRPRCCSCRGAGCCAGIRWATRRRRGCSRAKARHRRWTCAPSIRTSTSAMTSRTCISLVLATALAATASAAEPPRVSPATDAASAGLVEIRTLSPGIDMDIRYANANNFTGARVPGYEAPSCYLLAPVAKALAQVEQDLRAQGFGLRLYDCYRPVRSVQAFMAWVNDPRELAQGTAVPGPGQATAAGRRLHRRAFWP